MLTARQKELLDFIESYIAENGLSPTFEEMARALDSHKGNIHFLVTRLERRGAIRRVPNRERGITPVKGSRGAPELVAELIAAVDALGGCCCPYGIGHPSYDTHSDACQRVHAALARVKE